MYALAETGVASTLASSFFSQSTGELTPPRDLIIDRFTFIWSDSQSISLRDLSFYDFTMRFSPGVTTA